MNESLALQVLGLPSNEPDFGKIQLKFNQLMSNLSVMIAGAEDSSLASLYDQQQNYQKAYDFLCTPKSNATLEATNSISLSHSDDDILIL